MQRQEINFPTWIVASLLISLCAGCAEEEAVRQYQVSKSLPEVTTEERGEATHRMLAAIAIRGDQAWFFKAVGSDAQIAGQTDAFRALLASLRFEEDKPVWDLPADWRMRPGSEMRFATLLWGEEEQPTELSVIALPVSGDVDQYMLSNINRWRGQLQLAPIGAAGLAEQTETVPTKDGTATLVNLAGWVEDDGMGGMGAAHTGGAQAFAGAKPPSSSTGTEDGTEAASTKLESER